MVGAVLLLAGAVAAVQAREPGMRAGTPQMGSGLDLRSLEGPRFFTIQGVMNRRNGITEPRRENPSELRLVRLPAEGEAGAATEATSLAAPFSIAGYQQFPSMHRGVAAQWNTALGGWRKEKAQLDACAANPARCGREAAIFTAIRTAAAAETDRPEQLAIVNARVNAAVTYQSDIARHGAADLWSSPLQTLGKAGDCEDYAIAKYMILRELGWRAQDLAIILLRDRKAREDHAVLAARTATGWRLLDNRWNRIDDDNAVPHYRPVIAVNEAEQRLFAAPYAELADEADDEITLPAGDMLASLFETPPSDSTSFGASLLRPTLSPAPHAAGMEATSLTPAPSLLRRTLR